MDRRSNIEFVILLVFVFFTLLFANLGCGGYQPPAPPTTWVDYDAPAAFDPTEQNIALLMLRGVYPQLPTGGYVYWAPEPFPCKTDQPIYSGCTFVDDPPTIEVLWPAGATTITDTAFVYEIGVGILHVAPDGSPAADEWAAEWNAAIAAKLWSMR